MDLEEMERKLNKIVKWVKDSGLKVNKNKMELCVFHRKHETNKQLNVDKMLISSKNEIGFLTQLETAGLKSNKSCKKFITSNKANKKTFLQHQK